MVTLNRSIKSYLSIELQQDIWHRQIFNTSIVRETSESICLAAHGFNKSRISELTNQSSDEHQRKKQRIN